MKCKSFRCRLGKILFLIPALLALPGGAQTNRPTLWLIGDSTVRVGASSQRGWGDELKPHFDPAKIAIQNRALAGRSSRTFLTGGRWEGILKELTPGDVVIMQFGHNDAGPINEDPPVTNSTRARGTIRGNGEETQDIVNILTGQPETVHSYGWYLRHFITTAREKGATAIVCSPIPRKSWSENNTINRASGSYGRWAREAAEQASAPFVDLNEIIAQAYEQTGREAVEAFFADRGTHTSVSGAQFNARCVVAGLKGLTPNPLAFALANADHQAPPFAATPPAPATVKTTWNLDLRTAGPDAAYKAARGFGWLPDRPNVLAVNVPEGNYDVTLQFRNSATAAAATVKAESRRLMLMQETQATLATRRFTVNVRRPEIAGGVRVRLSSREKESFTWDHRLTLEFFPGPEGLAGVEIEPAPRAVTVYLAGDSTVTDPPREPWSAWGQMLPRFFAPGIAVANHAESGRALHSFRWENRLDKILSTIHPGDYLLIQFGHNDQKDKAAGAGPFTTYKTNLKQFITDARGKGAIPVIVTPMERRRWSGHNIQETLTDYAEAARQAGQEQDAPVIDLHAMSLTLYGALGETGSKRAFVHYPGGTFPGQKDALSDNSHHSPYGAYELARCVVQGLRKNVPALARRLREDAGQFDPAAPDAPERVDIPPSLVAETEKPEGD